MRFRFSIARLFQNAKWQSCFEYLSLRGISDLTYDYWSVTYTLTSEHFKNNIKIQISFEFHTFSNFFFQNGMGFTQKHYQKVVRCSRSEMSEQLKAESIYSRNLLWVNTSQITRLWYVCIFLRHNCLNTTTSTSRTLRGFVDENRSALSIRFGSHANQLPFIVAFYPSRWRHVKTCPFCL